MFCKKCGNELRNGDQFCWNCGNKIDAEEHVKDNDAKGLDIKDNEAKGLNIKDNTDTIDIPKKLYCKNCGSEVLGRVDVCINCGMRLRIVIIKDTGIAAVLSFFIPGLGYIYVGEIAIGVVMFFLEVLLLGLGTMMIRTLSMKEGYIFLLIGIMFWIYNIFGSYNMAERANKRQYE